MLELSGEFAALSAELRGAGDNQGAMRRIVELAVKHVEGCSWASITALRGGQGHSVSVSDEVARQVDELQYQFHEGPCLSAAEDATRLPALRRRGRAALAAVRPRRPRRRPRFAACWPSGWPATGRRP